MPVHLDFTPCRESNSKKEEIQMSVTEIDWLWFSGFGNGYQTVEMNMSPDSIVAQIWLHGAGPDSAYAGIKHYLQRLPASLFPSDVGSAPGTDVEHDFGEWVSWPPVVFDVMSSITFAIATSEDGEGWAMARLDHWK